MWREAPGMMVGHRRSQLQGGVVIGVDTGGTSTDAVLLDYHSRGVLASAKTLTTHDDLTVGVLRALDGLELTGRQQVRLVGISSTLATNAIAEGGARPVALALIGYDRELLSGYGLERKLAADRFEYFAGGHDSQGAEAAPLDLEGISRWVEGVRGQVEGLALSSYFSPLNPDHERRALSAVQQVTDLPVVLGHQLSSALDSVKRAATAALNASLVPVMRDFLAAVRGALDQREIAAPLMIVRGDGSLMSYEEALERPVETILSGPAASATGGWFLTGIERALMIDMGGTTTDMAVVTGGRMPVVEDGARVGEVETAVRSPMIRTVCLGCDSHLRIDTSGVLTIGPERVVPLCRLAARHRTVRQEVAHLAKQRPLLWTPAALEYWSLSRRDLRGLTEAEAGRAEALIELLASGPMSLEAILAALRLQHPVQLGAEGLAAAGVIARAALTPTDLLHAAGQMELWDRPVAERVLHCFCSIHGREPEAFVDEVFDQIITTLVEEVMVFLVKQGDEVEVPDKLDGAWARWLLEQICGGGGGLVSVALDSALPVVGLGAPAKIFLERLAARLGSGFELPRYFQAANAVGAVAGSIVVRREAICNERCREGRQGWIVRIGEEQHGVRTADEARALARRMLAAEVETEAVSAGASSPTVTLRERGEGDLIRVVAEAAGTPDLARGAAASGVDLARGALAS